MYIKIRKKPIRFWKLIFSMWGTAAAVCLAAAWGAWWTGLSHFHWLKMKRTYLTSASLRFRCLYLQNLPQTRKHRRAKASIFPESASPLLSVCLCFLFLSPTPLWTRVNTHREPKRFIHAAVKQLRMQGPCGSAISFDCHLLLPFTASHT